MEPVTFPGATSIFGVDQPEYLPLPAQRMEDAPGVAGRCVFCWRMSFTERVRVLFTGRVWHEVLTFNKPLQPQKLGVTRPR